MRETPGVPQQQLRLVRGALPIAGTFRQAGHAIVGQLTLTPACNAETIQSIKRQELTDTHTNRSAAIGWLVAGGVMAAIGAGLLVASGDADKQVSCGEGREGDKCVSESGAMQELGLTTLLSGVVFGAPGGIFLARPPKIESKDLPEKQLSHVTSQNVACAPPSSLEGIAVAVELPGNGSWSGRAAGDGSVRIEVQPTISLPEGATVQVVVQSVPPTFTSSVAVGTVLGEVSFEQQKSSLRPSPRGESAKR
ncbi:MAG TPA: hypothetical protein VGJ91_06490 [Polyangiaceae bacterium]